MTTRPLDEYMKLLTYRSVTQKWDVAVSYNAKKINKKLADRFSKSDASGMVSTLDISFNDKDRAGEYAQHYHIKFGSPLIQFISTTASPTCNLTMPVAGGHTWTTDDKGESAKTNIPANKYNIDLKGLMLTAAEGSSIIKDTIITLPDPGSKRSTITVCLDFATSSNYLSVEVETPAGDESAMSHSKLPSHIKSKFSDSSAGMHYQLASVNNEAPADNVIGLVPSKFVMATFSPEDNADETSLTLLIQTHESDRAEGNTEHIQSTWISNWRDRDSAPIPRGYTASIHISSEYFIKRYIEKTLTELGLSDIKEDGIGDGGMSFTAKWPSPLHRERMSRDHGKPDLERLPLEKTVFSTEVPARDYDPNTGRPFTLSFCQANGNDQPGTIKIFWLWTFHDTWSGRRFWRVYNKEPGGGPGFWIPMTDTISGSYKVDFRLDKTFDLPALDDEKFSVAAEVSASDWQTTSTNTSEPTPWELFCKHFPFFKSTDRSVPQWVTGATPKPTFTLNFRTLRFFLVTNILFPGEKVIRVDRKIGLLFPRDVLILGDVIND